MVAPDLVPQRHSSPAAAGPHGLDRAALARLVADVGPDGARDLCRLFLADLPGRITTMKVAFAAGDARGVARVAHGLTSAARLVGAAFLAELCAELDRKARSGRLDDPAAETFGMVVAAASRITGDLGGFAAPQRGE